MDFNSSLLAASLPLLLQGACLTLKITILSVSVGMLLGLFAGLARISQIRLLRLAAIAYIDFMRGTPLLVQLFCVYFALPVLTGQRIEPMLAHQALGQGQQMEIVIAQHRHTTLAQALGPAQYGGRLRPAIDQIPDQPHPILPGIKGHMGQQIA